MTSRPAVIPLSQRSRREWTEPHLQQEYWEEMVPAKQNDEASLLRSVALQNSESILRARQRAEQELLDAKAALERKTEELALSVSILELVNKTGAALSSNLDLRTLVQGVTDAATELSAADFGAFFYNSTASNGTEPMNYAVSGLNREAFEQLRQSLTTSLFGPTFRGEGPTRSSDVTKDPRYGSKDSNGEMLQAHLSIRSFLAIPVVSRSGEVIGGLFFGHGDADVFNERTERLLAGIASQAAIAIDNARLYAAAQRAAEERNQLLESERSARSEAERANTMKDEFLATLSHELRTPLSAILGWSQVLQLRTMNQAALQRGLETIERNARVQTQLIEDLLDMSRITSGKVRLDIQLVQPITFIEAALETVRPAAEAKGFMVGHLLDPTAGPIWGDPGRLQQVVWNLLSNAIKFTPVNGKVQVVLKRVNAAVEISVVDTGIGIKPEFIPHVFDRFRQGDASTTR